MGAYWQTMDTNNPVRAITHPLLNGGSIVHGFFARDGGVSSGIYSGLNCGPGSNDDPENVKKNRALAMGALGRGELFTCYQIHSPNVITVGENWRTEFSAAPPKADALVSNVSGVALGILTADCAPVLLADVKNGVIGALHAGWKGAVAGVVGNTVKAMTALGADPSTTVAVIGPTIGQQNYEVGNDVRDAVIKSIGANGEEFFIPSKNNDRWMFSLPDFVLTQLNEYKIEKSKNTGLDTYADEKSFFSYRRATHRDEKDYGRILSAIMICE